MLYHAAAPINPIQDGHFWAVYRWGEGKKAPLLKKICTYSTKMKLDIVILYLKKVQKIYESCVTPLEFC